MKYHINLFTPAEQTYVDKIILFSMVYLRYIIVWTMLVVLGVFMYRFTVDQDIVDLKDTLKQKQEIVEVSKPLLDQAAIIDNRTGEIKKLLGGQDSMAAMLNYYLSIFPEKITTTKMSVLPTGIQLEGTAKEAAVIQDFYTKIKNDKRFKTASITDLRKADTGYIFTLSLKDYIN
jgi:hypothetical protein